MSVDQRAYPRAKLKWPVKIKTDEGVMEGVTLNITPDGCFIGCRKPLRLNVVFDMAIQVPKSKIVLKAQAEVVWSNIYGPDDEISPRGMGVRFIKIPSEARKFIAQASLEHFKSADLEPELMQTLNTLVIDLSEENQKVPSSGR
ncbi:MAG: PilZ domain-containing protein [Deltaproteobacteria bacterium]|nr:PilZ domain-containing protein [Deltaproteobacteria bacterium]